MYTPRLRSVALLLMLAAFTATTVRADATAADTSIAPVGVISAGAFRQPPASAGVHVWWHWLDGAITREGITKDLEVMKAQGVVQATILNVGLFDGRSFGVPRVPFASDEWFAMYRWALTEAARLGITLGVHNCDGWSSSGGPWITPEQSMKQYTWSRTQVTGGHAIDVVLPQPAEIAGFYRDAAVVAYRSNWRPSSFAKGGARLTVNGTSTPLDPLVDGNPISGIAIKRGDTLVCSRAGGLAFSRVAVHLRRPFMWGNPAEFTTRFAVESSADGNAYQPVAEFSIHGLNRTEVVDVPRTNAPYVRVRVSDMGTSDAWIPVLLGELELLKPDETPAFAPSIPFLGEKTSAVKGADHAVDIVGDDTGAIAPSDIVVLTDHVSPEGHLHWDAPAGSWTILRFGYTTTGATNAPATREGRGLECDKMDPAAVEHHFHAFAEKLIDQAGANAGKTLRFILIDSWEAGFQNWTARLPAEFERRRGYNLIPWLPVLTGETVGSAQMSEAVLYDFRRTVADLIRENYYDHFAALLHHRNIELHAEVIYGGAGYPPLDVLRATQNVDLPMMEFWTSTDSTSRLEYKPVDAPSLELPVSAAVGYGKPLVGSEAYTGFAHYSETPAELKPFGDRGYAGGINRMILHSSVHQPTEAVPGMTLGRFASHFNRHNPYWTHARTWLEYQSRIQTLLGEGTPMYDVLYFLGDQLPQVYERNASTSLPSGYAVTAINADLLARCVTVVNGRLQLNGQGEAALLSLPAPAPGIPDAHGHARTPAVTMSVDTLKRLEVLVASGAHVYGPRPQQPLSLADDRAIAEFQALVDQLWGPANDGRAINHAYGKGTVSWGQPIAKVLDQQHVPPQFTTVPAGSTDFLFTHRRVGDADVFFVANQTTARLERECRFRVGARTPEIWDPETGAISRPALFRLDGEQLILPLRFEPRQALLFVFRPGLPRHYVTAITRAGAPVFPAHGNADQSVPVLCFDGSGIVAESSSTGDYQMETNDGRTLTASLAAPHPVTLSDLAMTLSLRGPGVAKPPFAIKQLAALPAFSEPEIRYFGGEAEYRIAFTVPDDALGGDRLWLNLGSFDAVAEVTLNGEPLAQAWNPGTPLDVTGRIKPRNELQVRVATTYRNRFIGDLVQFGQIRTLTTSAPVTDFLSARSPLKPSGLRGPITLTRVRVQAVPGW